ncbi:MAG: ABC transporter substrate-binding protein [Dehalococcoidia bacterium]|nr:ABC transporter substrate-binding protein [Dehalococcoidia bacterium]
MRITWIPAAAALIAVAGLSLVAAACGDDDNTTSTSGGGKLTAATVDCKDLGLTAPARIKSAGKLVVASDLSYAPVDFTKEGGSDPIGLDADIANCVAAAWGVKAQINNTPFDAIIPALTSKQADIIMSAMSVTDERQKQVDFVEYFNAGSGILVKESNPGKINSVADLCGKKVAIQLGTIQVDQAKAQNEKCLQKIDVQTFEQNTDTIQAVASGRADAALMDYPVAVYAEKTVKGTKRVGDQFESGPYGIAVRKDDSEVSTGLKAAIKAMTDKGKMDTILKYWDLEAGKLK